MKKIFIGMIALVGVVSMYAYTAPQQAEKSFTLYWYEYIDIPGNSPLNPQHYQRTASGGTVEPSCDQGNVKVCAVFAEPASSTDLEHPNLEEIDVTRMKP